MLFDESTLRKISQLTLVASKVRAGILKGDRRSTRRGSGIEFADFRNYVKGDDLRRLDWNIYARLDRPFIKLLEEEEDLAVHVLVDCSTSMQWGEGDQHKLRYALRLAGAIGAIALGAGDRLTFSTMQSGRPGASLGPLRGSQNLFRFISFLERLALEDPALPIGTDLNRDLKTYAQEFRRPGLAFILSDFFSPGGFESGLMHLLSRRYEVTALHILCPDELDPPLGGDLSLRDCETGQTQEVSIDAALHQAYRQRVQNWLAENRLYFHKRNLQYHAINTAQAWDKVILFDLRRAGVVR